MWDMIFEISSVVFVVSSVTLLIQRKMKERKLWASINSFSVERLLVK
jgi:hypothetical protein